MKTEKAPGKNGLPPEAYKLLAGLGEDVLEKIITDFWTNPDFNPQIWKTRCPYYSPEIWRSLQPQQVAWYCFA